MLSRCQIFSTRIKSNKLPYSHKMVVKCQKRTGYKIFADLANVVLHVTNIYTNMRGNQRYYFTLLFCNAKWLD